MSYLVKHINFDFRVDANWEKLIWKDVEEIEINYFMGVKPKFIPKTSVKLCYSNENLYVIFKVNDKHVIAIAEKDFDPVFEDSCVEFFFTPESNKSTSYFNLETNCGGTFLFGFRGKKGEKSQRVNSEDINKIEIATTLPKIIKEEIQEETTWYLEYKLPFSILNNYLDTKPIQPNTVWKANFYKCADKSSNPHWLTWSKVEYPEPNFHLPEFFGTLIFE